MKGYYQQSLFAVFGVLLRIFLLALSSFSQSVAERNATAVIHKTCKR